MQSDRLMYASRLGKMFLVVLAILSPLCVGPVYSASESGTITIVLPAEPATLDPSENTSLIEGKVTAKNIYESLVAFDADDSRISPCLATSWKQIDATTWRFFLRKGVKFHDGQDFNA